MNPIRWIDRFLCWLRGPLYGDRGSIRFRLFDLLDAPFWIGWPPYVRCATCRRIIDIGDPSNKAWCFGCALAGRVPVPDAEQEP